jgi:hypothetical protein
MRDEREIVYPTADTDLITMLERALDDASSELQRVAGEVGAQGVVVLFCTGAQVEVTYAWDKRIASGFQPELAVVPLALAETLKTCVGAVLPKDPLARVLRDFTSPESRSFLLFPWRMQQRVVTVVFSFTEPAPPYAQAPDVIAEKLRLIGLATWSVKEIAGLRSQLKAVAGRLAGRKLVERAKGVLQAEQGISEENAYEHLRRLSRRRRITLAQIAEEVVRTRGAKDGSTEQSTDSTGISPELGRRGHH